jgi:Fe2+ transport system protein FeoA
MPATALLESGPNSRRIVSEEHTTLAALPTRVNARIVRVAAGSEDASRLMALGICIGRQVQVVKQGDPLIVSVVGARIGLSARLASAVTVQVAEASRTSALSAAG